jgi:hypothetical protein
MPPKTYITVSLYKVVEGVKSFELLKEFYIKDFVYLDTKKHLQDIQINQFV